MSDKISDEAMLLAAWIKLEIGRTGGTHRADLWLPEIQLYFNHARHKALNDAAAMTENSPDGWNAERHAEAIRAMSEQQLRGFLDSLWPCGEHAHLANHTRTYLSAIIGTVPQAPRHENGKHLASVLRDLADAIDRCNP